MITTTNIKLDPAAFIHVYSGINGKCCCGCAGKHTYSGKAAGRGKELRGYEFDDEEVNERTFLMMLRKIERFINADERNDFDECAQYVSVVVGNRLYVAYRTPEARAAFDNLTNN